jgi:hypothetical protein
MGEAAMVAPLQNALTAQCSEDYLMAWKNQISFSQNAQNCLDGIMGFFSFGLLAKGVSMRRIQSSPRDHFKSVALYAEDLREIVNILKHDDTVEICADGYEYDSLDELFGTGKETVNSLNISRMNNMAIPSATFSVSTTWGVWVHCCDKESHSQLCELLDHRRRLAWLDRFQFDSSSSLFSWFLYICVMAFLGIALAMFLEVRIEAGILYAMIPVLVYVFFLNIYAESISYGKYSRVYLFSCHDKPKGFIARNREKVGVAVITALLTTLITTPVTVWITSSISKTTIRAEPSNPNTKSKGADSGENRVTGENSRRKQS